jgi:cyclophilin family peptidyl-prolyl cis-trans isomerase
LFGWETTVYANGGKTDLDDWRARSSSAQALAEIANSPATLPNRATLLTQGKALIEKLLATNDAQVAQSTTSAQAPFSIPEILRAVAAFKPENVGDVFRKHLTLKDVIVRGAAADLIGDLPPDVTNEKALIEALPQALTDELNDAALSILDSLGKQKTATANEAMKKGLESSDRLIRLRAATLLKANGAGDFSSRIGTVKPRNTMADYKRAIARRATLATITTSKGTFVVELMPDEAPLTVDNFVRLAQKGYFNGQTIPRVVPNFVVQAGDPRGDQNGGPGYSIRCEINPYPYNRGTVGMALSGKDTGGSQWFVTHSPQPHLDGGYTVFGHVVSGMEVVDRIVRGDKLLSVKIVERPAPRMISRSRTQE